MPAPGEGAEFTAQPAGRGVPERTWIPWNRTTASGIHALLY